ncbi:acetyl-CoA synthetase-like protein [Piedraia hortae CBS 480.64]|uniref:Acetyl-CoA synthetase-like protein n=1 Tax=Piedraia hortae CBS 480.64 TaxID=1314780 RepID=A0A6A7C066_9PEZI|nr:acetyl-CoA synthetase-like protein [Piedraia hortae CBS 480.64]
MPFTSAALPSVPDSISIETFIFSPEYGRRSFDESLPPFVCGLTGKSYSITEVRDRVECLSRALAKHIGPEKVIGVFSVNTIDYVPLAWAVHRIGGILTCVNVAYNASELAYQLNDSKAEALFTSKGLLETAKAAVGSSGLSMFAMDDAEGLKSLEELIQEGKTLPARERADSIWAPGEGARRPAFLNYSSGTSGLPKGVMISHANVIANVLQVSTCEEPIRSKLGKGYTQSALGLLPMSHIYGLVLICHVTPFRGDCVVVLPKYDFETLLCTVQDYKIAQLFLVPPMMVHMAKSKPICARYDLSSVRAIFTGAAPLGSELAHELLEMFPTWSILQGYGMTETATVVSMTLSDDVWFGSSGILVPSIEIRLVDPDGNEVTEYDSPGELWVKSPSNALGYLNNTKATTETFTNSPDGLRWVRTGDEAVVRKSTKGNEHLFITDRIKELIKVKGHQVAPAELEAHLLTHPKIYDCVVIGIPSEREGEIPKAFIVKAPGAIEESDKLLAKDIIKFVEKHKTNYKWLRGGVEFIDVVPKSPSGKILRRQIRDLEKTKNKAKL